MNLYTCLTFKITIHGQILSFSTFSSISSHEKVMAKMSCLSSINLLNCGQNILCAVTVSL